MSKRGLLLTIGTSHESEIFSVKELQPEYIALLCTEGREADAAIERICKEANVPHGNYYRFSFPDTVEALDKVVRQVRAAYHWLRERCGENGHIVANFTAGRKWMSAGLLLFLSRVPCEIMYVEVDYEGGQPKSETMRLVSLGANYAQLWQFEAERGIDFFNNYRFASAAEVFRGISTQGLSVSTEAFIRSILEVAEKLNEWDNFLHARTSKKKEEIVARLKKKEEIVARLRKHAKDIQRATGELGLSSYNDWADKILELADQIQRFNHQEDLLVAIVDLYKNAWRRFEMKQYDDAVARLYRCTEALADYCLSQCGCDPSMIHGLQCKVAKLRKCDPETAGYFLKPSDQDTVLRFQAPVSERNKSIIAHGWEAVSQGCAKKYLNWTQKILIKIGADPDNQFTVPKMPNLWL